MAIRDLQARFSTVGAIRLGAQKPTRSGRMAPAKLETFRVTVRDRALAEEIADLYGGEVQEWRPKQGNPGFEIYTTATELAVYVPRQRIDPNYELWGPNVLQRRCDGETEQIRQCPCLCKEQARKMAASKGYQFDEDTWRRDKQPNDCKPTTRLSVILAEVSITGTFKLESHGWNAAAELSVWAPIVEMATNPLPARIVLEKREKKELSIVQGREKIETKNFVVPVLDFGDLQLTGRQAFGGGKAAIEAAGKRASALAAGNSAAALAASPEPIKEIDWIAEISECTSMDELNRVRSDMKDRRVSDNQAIAAWRKAAAKFAPPKVIEKPAPVEVVADAVGEMEPDKDEVWSKILQFASKNSFSVGDIANGYKNIMGHDHRDETKATGWTYEEYFAKLQDGVA